MPIVKETKAKMMSEAVMHISKEKYLIVKEVTMNLLNNMLMIVQRYSMYLSLLINLLYVKLLVLKAVNQRCYHILSLQRFRFLIGEIIGRDG